MSLLLKHQSQKPEKCPNCGEKQLHPFIAGRQILGDEILPLACSNCDAEFVFRKIATIEIWEETNHYSYRGIAEIKEKGDIKSVVTRDYLLADAVEAATDITELAFDVSGDLIAWEG